MANPSSDLLYGHGANQRRAWIACVMALATLTSCCRATGEGGPTTLDRYVRGRTLVSQALTELGGVEAITHAGGLTVSGEGTFDLSARLQGLRPDEPDSTPIAERLAVDWSDGWVAYESDSRVNHDAPEHVRYIYQGAERVLLIDLLNRWAFWVGGRDAAVDRSRYARMVPHLLLADALDHRSSLRYLGRFTQTDGEFDSVSYTLESGETLTLLFDIQSNRLVGAEFLLDMPLLGDTEVAWRFEAYRYVEGLGLYPGGYRIQLGDRDLKAMNYSSIRAGVERDDLFAAPPDIAVPDPPSALSTQTAALPSPEPEIHRLDDGVYIAPNIRDGFHPLVVEFADFAVVLDTPAGWYEMQQLPPVNWTAGETSSSVGRRLLNLVHRTLPGKPIRYVALTHYHSDHIGGLRPFVAAGATILATPTTVPMVRRAVESSFTIVADELTGTAVTPAIEPVQRERTISDASMTLKLIDVGRNPHADGMLVAYLPRQRLLWVADLFEPLPDNYFPDRARVEVMRWFVEWLDHSGLEPSTIVSIHGTGRVTPEQIEKIRAMESSG